MVLTFNLAIENALPAIDGGFSGAHTGNILMNLPRSPMRRVLVVALLISLVAGAIHVSMPVKSHENQD